MKKGITVILSLLLVTMMGACDIPSGIASSSSSSSKNSASKNSVSEEIVSEDSLSESSSLKDSSEKEDSSETSSKEESSSSESTSSEDSSSEESSSSESTSSEDSTSEESSSNEETSEDISSSEETSSSEESSSSEEESSSSSSEEEEEVVTPVQPEYEFTKPINDLTSSKTFVKTKYKTEGAVVADAIVTEFGADPTGTKDSTSAIQAAINSVASMGGGSVFLPIGTYLVTATIVLPPYVSIVGDWNQPDVNNTDDDFDYGTVILAKPQALGSKRPQDNPLLHLGECSGVVGLTFYYVEQDAVNVKKYGYTIYANAPSTTTLKNLTFLNSSYGIGVSLNEIQNELVNLENIYGTFLYNAVHHNATTDVGFYNNINISPKYWQNASLAYKCSKARALETFVSEHLTAMILGDLDDQLISNVTIDGGNIGIKFTKGLRSEAGFWGLVHKANIICQTGVYADYLNSVSGVVFTDSNVGIVKNDSPVGCIKMSNSTYQAAGEGRILKEIGETPSSVAAMVKPLEFSSLQRLFIANNLTSGGMFDMSENLQAIIDSVGVEGGIVLIPNGVYRLNTTITIPKNVEIRSSQAVFSRSAVNQLDENGVVFISYVSGATFVLKENAGIVGVRIWHAKNDYLTAYSNLSSGNYPNDISIKAEGAGAYAYNNERVGAYVG